MVKRVDNWMPWYVGHYLTDTLNLTTEQHGAYCLLLMACWNADGQLPNDDDSLSAITKLPMDKWRKHKAKLLIYFTVSDEFITHGRVVDERVKAKEISAKKQVAGAIGGQSRWKGHSKRDSKRIAKGIANGKQTGWQTDTPLPLYNKDSSNLNTVSIVDKSSKAVDSQPSPKHTRANVPSVQQTASENEEQRRLIQTAVPMPDSLKTRRSKAGNAQ